MNFPLSNDDDDDDDDDGEDASKDKKRRGLKGYSPRYDDGKKQQTKEKNYFWGATRTYPQAELS